MNGPIRGHYYLLLPLGSSHPPWPGDPSVPSTEHVRAVQKPSSMDPQFLLRPAPLFSLLPDTIRNLPSGPLLPHRRPHLAKLEPLRCPGRGPKKGDHAPRRLRRAEGRGCVEKQGMQQDPARQTRTRPVCMAWGQGGRGWPGPRRGLSGGNLGRG